jgi:hypothetical protein
MASALSLETPLHRKVIIDRNKEYSRYSQELAKRIADLEVYVQSLNAGTDEFSKYWTSCGIAIQPGSQLALKPMTTAKK